MIEERAGADAGVIIAWPWDAWEGTPTLGITPVLSDEEAIDLAEAARRAALRAFGSDESAPTADGPTLPH